MGLEELVARLEAEAREEADALLAEARARAAEIRREAEEEARSREERWRERREDELRSEAAGRVAEARREARRRVLEARDELLERVRDEAERRLEGAEGLEGYRRGAPDRLSEALSYLGGAGAAVRCRPALAEALRRDDAVRRRSPVPGEEAPAPEIVVEEDPGAPVGLLVRAADGSVVVDDTLVERLRRRWDELAVDVVAAVPGDGPGEPAPSAPGTRPGPPRENGPARDDGP